MTDPEPVPNSDVDSDGDPGPDENVDPGLDEDVDPVADQDVDTGPLEDSQEKIDDARDSVREAMSHSAPADDMELPGSGQAAASGDDEEATPRPN